MVGDRVGPGLRIAAVALAGVAALAGCGRASGGPDAAASAGAASIVAATPRPTPSATGASATGASAQPTPVALDPDALPVPADLGPGWAYRVEAGDPEEAPGNGTAFEERDPAEIVVTILPMGCAQRGDSPVPVRVLQATYGHRASGAYAVALRMRFDDAQDAAGFAQVRDTDMAACRDQPEDPYSGFPAPVLEVDQLADASVARYRLVGERDIWTSIMVVRGTDVLTVDSDAATGDVDLAGAARDAM